MMPKKKRKEIQTRSSHQNFIIFPNTIYYIHLKSTVADLIHQILHIALQFLVFVSFFLSLNLEN